MEVKKRPLVAVIGRSIPVVDDLLTEAIQNRLACSGKFRFVTNQNLVDLQHPDTLIGLRVELEKSDPLALLIYVLDISERPPARNIADDFKRIFQATSGAFSDMIQYLGPTLANTSVLVVGPFSNEHDMSRRDLAADLLQSTVAYFNRLQCLNRKIELLTSLDPPLKKADYSKIVGTVMVHVEVLCPHTIYPQTAQTVAT